MTDDVKQLVLPWSVVARAIQRYVICHHYAEFPLTEGDTISVHPEREGLVIEKVQE